MLIAEFPLSPLIVPTQPLPLLSLLPGPARESMPKSNSSSLRSAAFCRSDLSVAFFLL
jgi:hypothetical protein